MAEMKSDALPATFSGIGSMLGTAGQVAGGFLGMGGVSNKDLMQITNDPYLNAALQASNFDLLNSIGFGNINNTPDPFEQLTGRIQSMQIAEGDKRRALTALNRIRQNKFAQGKSATDGGPVWRQGRLENALSRLGLNLSDLDEIRSQQVTQENQLKQLQEAGLGQMNLDTILNRARTAQTAAEIMGGAANLARTGQPSAGVGQDLFNRDERQLAELQDRLGIFANFGGINPATMFEQLTDAKLDQNLRLIEQQLGMSTAMSAALAPGQQAGSTAANQQTNASQNAAQIAAQQAQAANEIRAQQAQASAASLANGIGSGLSSLGSGFANAGILSQMGRQNDLLQKQLGTMSPTSTGLVGGGFSSRGLSGIANKFAVPGVNSGGFP